MKIDEEIPKRKFGFYYSGQVYMLLGDEDGGPRSSSNFFHYDESSKPDAVCPNVGLPNPPDTIHGARFNDPTFDIIFRNFAGV